MLDAAFSRHFGRAIEEMRRGRVSSGNMASALLERIQQLGFDVVKVEAEPDLVAMAAALTAAGYEVKAPPAPAEMS